MALTSDILLSHYGSPPLRDAADAEIRAVAGEMVSALRLLSESTKSITKPAVRYSGRPDRFRRHEADLSWPDEDAVCRQVGNV